MANLLAVLPEYVLYWIVQKGKERSLDEKEILFKQGEKNETLYIVLDGLLAAYDTPLPSKSAEIHGPGSMIGEDSAFSDGIAASTVVAEETSLLLEIPHAILGPKLEHDHAYAADFYRALVSAILSRLREAADRRNALRAAEQGDLSRDPVVRDAQAAIENFKQLLTALDKEGIKKGSVTEERYQQFAARARELMHTLHTTLGDASPLSPPLRSYLGERLQHEMLPYISTTHTADRFYSKPRGYAGDYLAIQAIYQNVPGGVGRVGPIVDRMFLETPPCKAVRNRRRLLADEIVAAVHAKPEGTVRIMCMASGPATEIFDAFARLDDRSRLRATLVDIDLHSLAFVDEIRTRQRLTNHITLVNENLIALYLGRGKTRVEPQDMIYSIGLTDYLNDRLVNRLLQYAYDSLAPGGKVILGNFHPNNPAKEFMDHVLEWNLTHRSEDDMNRLFKASAFRRPCTRIRFEEEGINLFAECIR